MQMLHASERRALKLSTFVASCICFAPGQVVSGAVLLVASLLLWRWDNKLLAREAALAASANETEREG